MATRSSHNKNNSAVKRILAEARELAADQSTDYRAAPLEEDIFEWHCTIRGPSGTEFEGGLYHCRVLLPSEYPFRPPSIMVMTPNGRFELHKKICISFTSYHEELWQPAWGIRTAIIGLQGFFPLKGEAALGVGALDIPVPERKRLAKLSREWVCPHCEESNLDILPDPPTVESSSTSPPLDTVPLSAPPAVEPATQSEEKPQTSLPAIAAETPHLPLSLKFDGNADALDPNASIELSLTSAAEPKVAPEIVTSTSAAVAAPIPEQTEAPPPPPRVAEPVEVPQDALVPRPPIAIDAMIFVLASIVLAILAKKIIHVLVSSGTESAVSSL